jgi:hypothetical protein
MRGWFECENISVMWGGKQSKVRATEIKEATGFLGPHTPKLSVCDIQQMQFQEQDEDPFYLDPVQRQLQKYDEIKGVISKKRLKKIYARNWKHWVTTQEGKHFKKYKS